MSDLLHAFGWIQTAISAKSTARTALWILGAFVLWFLWNSEATLTRALGFIGVDVAIFFGIATFLQAPLEWIDYLFVQLIFGLLSASRIVIKLALMALAGILSLVYFISPIDFIPDILLGLGWIDDVLVAIGLFSYAARSEYAMPVPKISPQEAAAHPAWKMTCLIVLSTSLTILCRAGSG